MSETAKFSPQFLEDFIYILHKEIGKNHLEVVISKAGMPETWADADAARQLSEADAANAYAGIQKAMRVYYGRGARGLLQRIGAAFWEDMLAHAPFREKTQSRLVRGMPKPMRGKAALDILARLLGGKAGTVSAHTLDLDLMLVDKSSATAVGQQEQAPICFVTVGLIRGALFWALGVEPDVEEVSCQAAGAASCEFKIHFGEK
jgi:predicted hydrocarbon binding protein